MLMLWLATCRSGRPGIAGWRWSKPRSWASARCGWARSCLERRDRLDGSSRSSSAAGPPTTYASASGLAGAADVLAGLLLRGGQAWALIARPRVDRTRGDARRGGVARARLGRLGGGAPLLRSLGMVAAPSCRRLPPRAGGAERTGAFALGPRDPDRSLRRRRGGEHRALFRDLFLDRYCWSNCTTMSSRAEPDLARLLGDTWLFSVAVGAGAVVALESGVSPARPWWRRQLARRSPRAPPWPRPRPPMP